jgi:hypothetical protein
MSDTNPNPTPAPAQAPAAPAAQTPVAAPAPANVLADLAQHFPNTSARDVARIDRLYRAEKPEAAGYSQWLASTVAQFADAPRPTAPGSVPGAAPTYQPHAVTAPIATGAAGTGVKMDPGDLSNIDPAVLASLPLEERMKRYEALRASGPNSNPYAGARTRQLVRLGRK